MHRAQGIANDESARDAIPVERGNVARFNHVTARRRLRMKRRAISNGRFVGGHPNSAEATLETSRRETTEGRPIRARAGSH